MINFRKIVQINFSSNELLNELKMIIPDYEKYKQICVNSPIKEKTFNHQFCIGSLKDGIYSELKTGERNFEYIQNVFKNTKFESLLNRIKESYVIGRTRILTLNSRECYSWHNDPTKRLHLVLSTNEGTRMIIDNEVCYMPEDTCWLVDTTKNHTFVNAGKTNRIHIVTPIFDDE